jgi:hypothetical protein
MHLLWIHFTKCIIFSMMKYKLRNTFQYRVFKTGKYWHFISHVKLSNFSWEWTYFGLKWRNFTSKIGCFSKESPAAVSSYVLRPYFLLGLWRLRVSSLFHTYNTHKARRGGGGSPTLRYPLSFYVHRHFICLLQRLFICRSNTKSIEGKFGYKNSDARI